jgi:hypothetical protein
VDEYVLRLTFRFLVPSTLDYLKLKSYSYGPDVEHSQALETVFSGSNLVVFFYLKIWGRNSKFGWQLYNQLLENEWKNILSESKNCNRNIIYAYILFFLHLHFLTLHVYQGRQKQWKSNLEKDYKRPSKRIAFGTLLKEVNVKSLVTTENHLWRRNTDVMQSLSQFLQGGSHWKISNWWGV